MFLVTSTPIDPAQLRAQMGDREAGACVTFEGWVRARNEGRPVDGLEYEAHSALAEKEGGRILAEARAKFPILGAVAVHRVGSLALGELAVWVGVTAGHRAAAFEACRYIIDESKARLPIWKKEHYSDGSRAWVNAGITPERRNLTGFDGNQR
jgi:molybdopterin synthase catalytic subunit